MARGEGSERVRRRPYVVLAADQDDLVAGERRPSSRATRVTPSAGRYSLASTRCAATPGTSAQRRSRATWTVRVTRVAGRPESGSRRAVQRRRAAIAETNMIVMTTASG